MWEYIGTPQTTNIVSLILVIATGAYVFLTYRIAKANSLMAQQTMNRQESISRPVISANIEVRSQVLFVLLIRNTGASVASNVRLELDRDFFRFGERKNANLRDLEIFKSVPFTLAQGDCLRFDLAQGFVIFADDSSEAITPSLFKIRAAYSSSMKEYQDDIVVDLKPYRMTNWPKSEIALEIEKLTKAVEKKRS